MAFLNLPSRSRRQPQQIGGIDWSHPLARLLRIAVVPAISPLNIATSKRLSGSVSNPVGTKYGVGGQYVNYIEQGFTALQSQFTLFQIFRTGALPGSSNKGGFGLYGTNYMFGLYIDHTDAARRGSYWSSASFVTIGRPTGGALSANTEYCFGVSYGGNASLGTFLYNDGRATLNTTANSLTVTEASLGSTRGPSIEVGTDVRHVITLLWDRLLDADDHAELYAFPWQIFKPVRGLRIYSLASAGGGGTTDVSGKAVLGATEESSPFKFAALQVRSVTLGQSASTHVGDFAAVGLSVPLVVNVYARTSDATSVGRSSAQVTQASEKSGFATVASRTVTIASSSFAAIGANETDVAGIATARAVSSFAGTHVQSVAGRGLPRTESSAAKLVTTTSSGILVGRASSASVGEGIGSTDVLALISSKASSAYATTRDSSGIGRATSSTTSAALKTGEAAAVARSTLSAVAVAGKLVSADVAAIVIARGSIYLAPAAATPNSRTLPISAESRSLRISQETRAISIPLES